LGSHLIDQSLTLFGTPQSITADIRIQRPGGKSDDYFHLILDYGSFPVILHGTSMSRGPGFRYIFNGSLGSLVKTGVDPQEEQLKRGDDPRSETYGVEDTNQWGTLYLPGENDSVITATLRAERGDYPGFYKGFAQAIRGVGENPVPVEQGALVIKLIEAAQESSRLGKTILL
jgi:scyllo-inositol 2-dehydrogenase (NADP+)